MSATKRRREPNNRRDPDEQQQRQSQREKTGNVQSASGADAVENSSFRQDNGRSREKVYKLNISVKTCLVNRLIVAARRERVKKRSKATLMAQMRPFSFTQREEEMDNLTKRLSRSTPNLHLEDFYEPNYKSHQAQFKAKPVPKNLFSNYVYKKMHEDEFYRALQKKIRAEEMFRAASLPPSMAKRERCMLKAAICSRALNINDEPVKRTGRKVNRKRELICNERDGIGELMREYLSYVPKSFGKRTKKKRVRNIDDLR